MNIKISDWSHIWEIPDRIPWEPAHNPYARTVCRVRKITKNICDGTCPNCKKERENFLEEEPKRMKKIDIIATWWDPDAEIPDISIYQENIQKRIERIEEEKKNIIANFRYHRINEQ